MGWGALSGLGQGLQQVGGMISDYNKDKLQQKLELEREGRAESRQIAREQREQATYGKSDFEQDGDGVWWQVDYNKGNREMERRLAPKSKIDELTRAASKSALEDEVLGYKRDTYKAEAGIAGELAGLKVEEARADIGATHARARASEASADNSRASAEYTRSGRGKALDGSDSAPERSQVVTDIIKDLGSFGEDVPKADLVLIVEQSLTHAENQKRKGVEVDPLSYARTVIANRYSTSGSRSLDGSGSKPRQNATLDWR